MYDVHVNGRDLPSKRASFAKFFYRLSPRARWVFYAGVFLFFAPGPVTLQAGHVIDTPVLVIAGQCFLAGVTALAWLHVGLFGRKWLLVSLPLMALAVWFTRVVRQVSGTRGEPTWLGLACVVAIVGGYILFVRFIRHEGVERLRLDTEVGLAREIHARLVPPIDVRQGRVEVLGRSVASSEVGGDLVDAVESDGGITLCVADVSGHGVGAGLLMAMVKSALRTRAFARAGFDTLLPDLNRLVFESGRPDMFVTCACLHFDGSARARFALAGHPPILHYRRRTDAVEELGDDRLPLGVLPDAGPGAREVAAEPQDLFLVVTDGLTEVVDRAGEEFGLRRLAELLRANAEEPLEVLSDRMLRAVAAHGPREDDQSLLLARVRASREDLP